VEWVVGVSVCLRTAVTAASLSPCRIFLLLMVLVDLSVRCVYMGCFVSRVCWRRCGEEDPLLSSGICFFICDYFDTSGGGISWSFPGSARRVETGRRWWNKCRRLLLYLAGESSGSSEEPVWWVPLIAVGVEVVLLPWLGLCFLWVTCVLWLVGDFGGSSGSSASSTMPLLLGQIPGVDCRCATKIMSCGFKKLEVAPTSLVVELEFRPWRSFPTSSGSKGASGLGTFTKTMEDISVFLVFFRVFRVKDTTWSLCCLESFVVFSFLQGVECYLLGMNTWASSPFRTKKKKKKTPAPPLHFGLSSTGSKNTLILRSPGLLLTSVSETDPRRADRKSG